MFLLLVTKLLQPLIPSHLFLIFVAWDQLNKIQTYPPPTLHNCLITASQHLSGYQAVLGLIQNHSLCSKRITMTMVFMKLIADTCLASKSSMNGLGSSKISVLLQKHFLLSPPMPFSHRNLCFSLSPVNMASNTITSLQRLPA